LQDIRVEAPDLRSAMRLVQHAGASYRTELVPLQRDAWEVRVADGGESAAGFDEVFSLVERWLDDAEVATTTVHLDGHLYTMNRRVRVA